MTQGTALKKFFSSFGIPAYPNTAVPKNPTLPYLTYEVADGIFSDEADITVQIWYKTTSEATPNAKVKEIKQALGIGGKILQCDDGALWIKSGTPFCIPATAQDDNTIKLRQLNLSIEFLTQ